MHVSVCQHGRKRVRTHACVRAGVNLARPMYTEKNTTALDNSVRLLRKRFVLVSVEQTGDGGKG
jgi:hypothetical protein